jgi:hypothetical protein
MATNIGLLSLPGDLELVRKSDCIALAEIPGEFEADFDPAVLF